MTEGRLRAVRTDDAPRAIGPYSQGMAVEGGRFVFTSGQIPLDPRTGEFVPGGIREQTARVLENIGAILAAEGLGPRDVARTTVFLADLGDFAAMNEVYEGFFGAHRPARTTIQAGALPKGARIEIDAIAVASPTS